MTDRYASLKQGLVGCWIPSVSGSGLLLPDLSGRGNNGSLVGMDASDWLSSQYGRALDFDGSNDYVQTSLIGSNTSPTSFCAWINFPNTTTGRDYFVRNGVTGVSGGWSLTLFQATGGNIGTGVVVTSPDTQSLATSSTTYSANSWHHVVGIWRPGVSIEAYVNGVFQASTAANLTTLRNSALGWTIGRIENVYAAGMVDDCRVYDRVLTPSEIRLLASEPGIGFKPAKKLSRFSQRFTYKPAKPRNYSVIRNRDPNYSTLRQGLVAAYCPSISGQGNVLPDLVGGNHGTLTNMTADDWASSGDGRALDFDYVAGATRQAVELSNNVSVRGLATASISLWCNLQAAPADNAGLYYEATASGGFTKFGIYQTNANALLFVARDTSSGSSFLVSHVPTSGVWLHVAGTYNAHTDLMEMFVNGVSVGRDTTAKGILVNDAPESPIAIGAFTYVGASNAQYSCNAQLDDIRIYNRALSESEIRLLASKRGIGLEPRKPKITFTDLGVQKTYSVVRVKETDYATLRQGLVGAWCPSLANGGSGNTLPDVSGYGNHGVLTNMGPEDWVSGQYGRALDFDGSDDYVTSAAYYDAGSLSFSFWAYFSGTPANYPMVLQWRRPSQANATQSMQVLFRPTGDVFGGSTPNSASGNRISFAINGATTATTHPFFAMTANTWQHWAGTYDGSNLRLFNSGVLGMTVAGSFANTAGAWNVDIANNRVSPSDGYFKGQLDDIRIYSRALTEPEIRLLASRPGIGLRQESHRNTFYQFPSGARRKRILTGMP